MSETFFWDTYAFFELINKNENYFEYATKHAITTIFNLAELNYNLKKEFSKSKADEITSFVGNMVVDVSVKDIIVACDLKKKNRKLSLPDCIGYVAAKRYGAKFLTGDKEFEKMSDVEFVK